MIRWLAKVVQGERIGWLERKCRVVGLHAVAPYAAIGTKHRLRMRVDRQEQALTWVTPDLVVPLRGIPVVDQQAILVGQVFDPVTQQWVVQETEVVRANP